MHVIDGLSVTQLNVTVPLNPGWLVRVIPKVNVPPGGTVGPLAGEPPGGGTTESTNGAFVIVRVVFPLTSAVVDAAEIIEVPALRAVARPFPV